MPQSYHFSLLTKFAGVSDNKATGALVTVRFINGELDLTTDPIPVTYSGNGTYAINFSVLTSQLPVGPGYHIIVKGEKHVARRFCKASGQTSPCQPNESITIQNSDSTSSMLTYDFTGLSLDPGDVYPQDGKADSTDFSRITARLSVSTPTTEDKRIADLNYDGIINISDVFWMRKTLETRYDE